ncbi:MULTISPECIES: sensor domain-containing diguanylate cyclase [Pseudoalteromonas]|uniref:diguanylate cyclase n=1 Tax=Pseudoalteromonas fuliginea TaxID=1872678 RepID=A0ABQ6RIU4_9GAMM|nr:MULTISPECIES: sensor domain-containing diguanylate cyclase [Pseudoalteromonas]KAA1157187.1 sensor domain-containing diguanylate cyclase [Pseudoalteromonas fuliginea]KAA1167615.1 sensor domain-containing diguanylate cyclase [Pseudoalteromonas fuliginea]MDQ2045747.1 sensor domain-containing diguanylate cyclase [Pseudoalteromonas sp. 20-92]
MNYAYQINEIKSLVEHYTLKSSFSPNDLSANTNTEFKKAAYHLFYELIKLKSLRIYQEPNHITELFGLIKQSSFQDRIEKKALAHVEYWWLEWYFALEMDEKINTEKNNTAMSYLSQSTQHPMRKHELSHYAKLFAALPMPVCNVCARTGDILRVNQRFVDVFGYTVKDVPNLNIWWQKAYPDIKYREFAKTLWDNSLQLALKNNNDIPANNYRVSCKNGSQVMMEVSGIDIGEEFLAVFKDATERLQAEDILRDMAFLDALTKIANRRRFDEKLTHEFERAKAYEGSLSLIILDIDHFKEFNDLYGHVAGDTCLYDVAQKIASTVSRPEDFVARYGGEEFIVLLPQTDKQGALFIAEQIQKAIENLAIAHEGSFTGFLSVSMGINTIDKCTASDELNFIKAADSALYYAKRQGRNCIALSAN